MDIKKIAEKVGATKESYLVRDIGDVNGHLFLNEELYAYTKEIIEICALEVDKFLLSRNVLCQLKNTIRNIEVKA